jgi:uncharacterized protein
LTSVFVLGLVLVGTPTARTADYPAPVGYINDFAGIISPEAENVMSAVASEVKAKTGAEISVVTIETTGGIEIEAYSVDLYMAWGIGEKGKDNGVLLLVAFQDQQLWIKTGYGLEGAIPDAEAHRIYRDVLRPGFRAGQYDQALLSATTMLADLILGEIGGKLAFSDSLAYRQLLARQDDRVGRSSRARTLYMLLSFFMPLSIFVLLRIAAARRGYGGRRGGGFWIGGVGGTSGGFGGGVGGFGGGACGGGGAGGGW